MRIQQQFEEFYSKIKLTTSQKEDAKKKYDGVCKKLHDYYYPDIEYSGTTKLLIGSYGKHTNIRPPRDVDVLFIMPKDKFSQYDDNESNGQSQLLQDIKKILSKKYTTTDKIRGWGKVVLIQFADGTHDVELLPAWEQDDGKFIIPNTEKGGHWEIWDPRTEIQNIEDSDKTSKGKTRALIRMIKKWSENCSVKIKSHKIENEVLEFFEEYETEDKDYSILVRDFFECFLKNADEESKSHIKTALSRAIKACDFEEQDKFDEASEEWKKIFGDDFPSPNEEKIVAPSRQSDLVLGDSSHCKPLQWSFQRIYRVNINAYVYVGNKSKKLGGINSDGRNLAKGFQLKFIANTNASGESKYYWQVVNTGKAAKEAGGLRGKIFEGGMVRWEHTEYHGKHWIECFIVRNNICVARSGKFFVNIK